MNANDIWLIAGLGNPESKYDGTRHNAGFAALDHLAGKWGIAVSKTKFQGLWGQGEVEGHKVVLLKPLTYMNLSGDSIASLAGFFKVPADHVVVLCDDITQAPQALELGLVDGDAPLACQVVQGGKTGVVACAVVFGLGVPQTSDQPDVVCIHDMIVPFLENSVIQHLSITWPGAKRYTL